MSETQVTRNPIRSTVLSVSKDGKTAKVKIPRIVPAGRYVKRLHKNTVLFADSSNFKDLNQGDIVEIFPCRRISKLKTWEIRSLVSNQKSKEV